MFFFGMLLGLLKDNDLRRIARSAPTAGVLLFYLAIVAIYVLLPFGFAWFAPLFGTASSLLFVKTCYDEGLLNRLFSIPLLRFVGNISYSFYLIHSLGTKCVVWVVAAYFPQSAGSLSCMSFALVAMTLSLTLATATFVIAERWYFAWNAPNNTGGEDKCSAGNTLATEEAALVAAPYFMELPSAGRAAGKAAKARQS
jgi:peptidoglycan/LPS O-acetylase OafA/YrhL